MNLGKHKGVGELGSVQDMSICTLLFWRETGTVCSPQSGTFVFETRERGAGGAATVVSDEQALVTRSPPRQQHPKLVLANSGLTAAATNSNKYQMNVYLTQL